MPEFRSWLQLSSIYIEMAVNHGWNIDKMDDTRLKVAPAQPTGKAKRTIRLNSQDKIYDGRYFLKRPVLPLFYTGSQVKIIYQTENRS